MRNLLQKKDKGFTLIEIVLVLAIAGLIMVIVFLAVSGAQRSRRDTQRKNDLSRVASQLEQYASNNNGTYPADQAAFKAAIGQGGQYEISNGLDPLAGSKYTYDGTLATPNGTTPADVKYVLSADCQGNAQGTRVYAVTMSLEQGSVCRTNL